MPDICKETLCSSCAHRPVCSKTEEFLKVVKALDDVTVHTGDHSMVRLRDISWVHLKLDCTYFVKKSS